MYKDVASIYQQQGVELNPTYFPLFNLLHQHGPLSVTQAAEILNVSHPAISKIAVKMQREELLYKTPDPDDERRYFLALDKKSLQLLTKIDPILREMRTQLDTIINTQQHPILDSQGYGIGRKLLLVALDKAREVNANSVYLESSSLLTNALTLYRNMGFSEIEHPEGKSHYKRSDIYMELTI